MARYFKKRRAVSQVIISLILVAIVVTVGTPLLFRGLGEINTFSLDLNNYNKPKMDALREDIVFENIHFNRTSTEIRIDLANVGTNEVTITTVTVVKANSQELIISWKDISKIIQIDSSDWIEIPADLTLGIINNTWSDSYFNNSTYKIGITTAKGNFFTTLAKPYNT